MGAVPSLDSDPQVLGCSAVQRDEERGEGFVLVGCIGR
jgi:hypothetical protein